MNSLIIVITSSIIIALYSVILIIMIGILDEVKAIEEHIRKQIKRQ